jgi:hypothetical protein
MPSTFSFFLQFYTNVSHIIYNLPIFLIGHQNLAEHLDLPKTGILHSKDVASAVWKWGSSKMLLKKKQVENPKIQTSGPRF